MSATTIGYRFIIQSEKTPEYLETRIDAFLTGYTEKMLAMSEADFESHKRSLITKRLEKLKNLDQESSRHWNHIDTEYFDFESVYHDATHIQALSKGDMIEFFEHYVSPASSARSKLAIHLHAKGNSAPEKPAGVIEEGMKLLKLGPSVANEDGKSGLETKKAYVIDNVREFKSMLAVSAGPRPVRDLSEFEDLDSKL